MRNETARDKVPDEPEIEKPAAGVSQIALKLLKPVATMVLKHLSRSGPLMILMDRMMINDTLNLLYLAVSFGGRVLPLGWVVAHEGNSNLALQQQLLTWMRECLPTGAEVYIVADREFHSIHLARWIQTQMKVHFVLRIKAGAWVRLKGRWRRASRLASRCQSQFYSSLTVTRHRRVADFTVNLLALWTATRDRLHHALAPLFFTGHFIPLEAS